MKNKKLLLIGLVLILTVSLLATGCGGGQGDAPADENQTYTFRLGMVAPPNHPYSIVSYQYADAIYEATDGRINIQVYDSGQLGDERSMIEEVQYGTLDMVLTTIAPVSNFVEDFGVFDLPFIFVSREHAYNTLDGPVGQEMAAMLEDINIKSLGYWENGFRQIYNSRRPIHSPEDLNGLRMRVMENDVHLATFRALGADATPINWPETYTSLQQGVVHGFETTIGIFETSNMYEVQDYASLVNLFYAGAIMMINDDIYNSLPADLQAILSDLGVEYGNIQRAMVAELDETQLSLLEEEHGIEVVYDIDVEPFIEAVQSVYENNADRFGLYYERIQAERP